jgi:DNA-binding response OmpR family regulator
MDNNTKKLLLIENDAVISETIQKSLERYNYSVVSAYTGGNALEIFSKNNDIDLVLISIDIADAVETASAIFNQKEIPILFLSEHDESEMYSKTENIKCYGYVLKNSGAALIDALLKQPLYCL